MFESDNKLCFLLIQEASKDFHPPPACHLPPHNLGFPSTRWAGLYAVACAPADHGVHQNKITAMEIKLSQIGSSALNLYLRESLAHTS